MNLISQVEAAEILGISRAAVSKWKHSKVIPSFMIEDVDGVYKIDMDHPDWKIKVKSGKSESKIIQDAIHKKTKKKNKAKSSGGRYFQGKTRDYILKRDNYTCQICGEYIPDGVGLDIDHIIEYEEGGTTTINNGQTLCHACNIKKHHSRETGEKKDGTKHQNSLETQASEATLKGLIFNAKIKEERSKQEEIKTLEKKKDVAPMYLIAHFFSFAEGLIQRLYRIAHEIEPELSALYLAKQPKMATAKLKGEMESVIIDAQKDLIEAIQNEELKPFGAPKQFVKSVSEKKKK